MDDSVKLNCASLKTFKLCILESVIYLPEVFLPGTWCGWSQIAKDTMAYWQDLVRRKSVKIQEILICSFSALFVPGYLAWVLCSFSHKHDTSYNFVCHTVGKHSVFT